MQETLAMGVGDAATVIGLSVWTVRKYIRQGKIRALRIGRRVLVEPAELERLIERGRIGDQRHEPIV